MIDKVGNDGADKLACDGAALHAVNIDVASEAKARFVMAKTVQRMMTHILEARLAATPSDAALGAAGRGASNSEEKGEL